jgi:hypothetical protein
LQFGQLFSFIQLSRSGCQERIGELKGEKQEITLEAARAVQKAK